MSHDLPRMEQPSAVRDLELRAIALYRRKYPSGTPWHELATETRVMWVGFAEHRAKEQGGIGKDGGA